MKKSILFKGIIIAFGFLFFNFQKAPTTHYNAVESVDFTDFVPCADGGGGELVDFSGDLHVIIDFTISGNRLSYMYHFQPMGLKGVGQVTGDSYNATGITQEHGNASLVNGQFEFTFVNNYKLIGQGKGNNVTVHETVHGTMNANGEITTFSDKFNADCK